MKNPIYSSNNNNNKKIKYLGVKLSIYVPNLCKKNSKPFLENPKTDLNEWIVVACSWIG